MSETFLPKKSPRRQRSGAQISTEKGQDHEVLPFFKDEFNLQLSRINGDGGEVTSRGWWRPMLQGSMAQALVK
jgi:hypothetical protein